MDEDADLVGRARRGERAAWDALVARYAGLVLGVARRQGLREADREDVAQVVWLKLAQNLDSLAKPSAVRWWLATTCRNESLRFGARAAREIPSDSERFYGLADDQNVEETVLRQERDRQLWDAFSRLSALCQSLLRMIADEVPYLEISARLDRPIGAIGPTRQRCLGKLRTLLGDELGISGLSTES